VSSAIHGAHDRSPGKGGSCDTRVFIDRRVKAYSNGLTLVIASNVQIKDEVSAARQQFLASIELAVTRASDGTTRATAVHTSAIS